MADLDSFMLTDIQEHFHLIPGQDGSSLCVDVMRYFNGALLAVDWYSFTGRDLKGHVEFENRAIR